MAQLKGGHLWPARAEYLPDQIEVGQVAGAAQTKHGTVLCNVSVGPGGETLFIDLRSVLARGHAAMAYTDVSSGGVPRLREQMWSTPDQSGAHITILCRMRALDESVTVTEARAALEWAESVRDGGR